MDELAKRFADLAEKYSPNVIDAARGAVRVEAYSTLAASVMLGAFAIAGLYLAWWLHKREEWDDARYIAVFFAGVVGAICLSGFIWAWIDPWTWTAINHPDLYMAKKALKL